MVMVVVPAEVITTEVGGSGLGGAKESCHMKKEVIPARSNIRAQVAPLNPNLHVHWKLPIVLVQSDVVVLQLCVPQLAGTPVHSLHRSVDFKNYHSLYYKD